MMTLKGRPTVMTAGSFIQHYENIKVQDESNHSETVKCNTSPWLMGRNSRDICGPSHSLCAMMQPLQQRNQNPIPHPHKPF